ncbi:MAG: hypothetical protein Kow0037_15420 [Calditrichia bacterium]
MKTNRGGILKHLSLFLCALFFLVFLQCASRVAPSGGPPDKTPPEVVSTFPARDSVNVQSVPYIEIRFSENIQQSSIMGNYWIVPPISDKVELKWSGGKKVRLIFKKPELKKQTYVVTLGNGIKDLRGNRMMAPFQFAFSTGAKLDSGKVAGAVMGEELPEEVFVYAYGPTATQFPDTFLNKPSGYYTQVDQNGHFEISYLPWGRYRLLALADKNFDKIYSFGQDEIAIPAGDIQLSSKNPFEDNLFLQLIQEDTLAPALRRVDAVSAGQLRIHFSEPVITDSTSTATFLAPNTQRQWRADGMAVDSESPRQLNLYFKTHYPADSVVMQLHGIRDLAGNRVKKKLTPIHRWPQKADTTQPPLPTIWPENNANAVKPDDTLRISFDRPVAIDSLKQVFRLTRDSVEVIEGNWEEKNAREFLFLPSVTLPYDSQFTLKIELGRLQDWWGNAFPDTVLISRFRTVDKKQLGELSLTVSTGDTLAGQAILTLKKMQSSDYLNYVVPTNKTALVPDIPEGKYLLRAVWDKDGDRKWFGGSTRPWRFAEPFVWFSDTVQIRKRWTTEGIRIEFGETP